MSDYIKEIYEIKKGDSVRFEIHVVRNGKLEKLPFETEEKAYNAYVELCGEIYGK